MKSDMMEVEEILKPNKYVLRTFGFWPSENLYNYTLSRLKGYIAVFFIFLGTSFVIFAQITLVGDTIVFIEDTILILLVKMKRGKMVDYWLARREMATKFLTAVYVILTITYIISPLYLSGRSLPFQGNFPSIFFQDPWYQLIYVSEIMLTLLAVTNTLACDVVLIFFVCQLCNDLHRTAILLQQYGDDECSLRDVINQHISSLNYGEIVCRALSVMVFGQNCICSMTICLACYVFFTVENRLTLMKMIVVLMAMIPVLFINCYSGEMIYSASLSVSRAIDTNCWKSDNIRANKDGIFIVQRAQKPMQIAVGTFAVINLKFFCDSMYNAISYAMILKTMS
ncbi:odorant receptor 7 [Vespula maculifrons]|uniref:Odorant receptor 7 n=1 Tax=Vespula maculifrons TaxID=7453 RepID=A0ABD2BFY2_VESMC